jgi:hypothetical protein
MTPADVEPYPELRQLCGAYLNAEFPAEYGSVAGALRAYRRETGAGHRGAARRELDHLTAAAVSDEAIGDELVALGCEVYFDGPAQARALLDEIRSALAD